MSNVVDGGTGVTPTPIILNARPAGAQIQSSSTPVMMQSSAGGQSPRVDGSSPASGDVMMLSASSVVGSPSSPSPQSVAAVTVTPCGIMIWSATGASSSQPYHNGPAAGQASPLVVQSHPVTMPSSPAPQVRVSPSNQTIQSTSSLA